MKKLNTFVLLGLASLCTGLSAIPHPGHARCKSVIGNLPRAWHQYYDVQAWNADASVLLIVEDDKGDGTRKKKTYLVRDLERAQPQEIKAVTRYWFFVQWSATDPHILYYTTDEGAYNRLHSYSIETGEIQTVFDIPESDPLRLMGPHPDGEHLLFAPNQDKTGKAYIYTIAGVKVWQHHYTTGVHRTRFTKAPDLAMWVNYSSEMKGSRNWKISTDGTELKLENIAGHLTCNPNGKLVAANSDGRYIRFVDLTSGDEVHSIYGIAGASHLMWSPCGRFVAVDVAKGYGDLASLGGKIALIDVEDNYSITEVCYHHVSAAQYRQGVQKWHPHVVVSPDSKKLVFNSCGGSSDAHFSEAFVVDVPKAFHPDEKEDNAD